MGEEVYVSSIIKAADGSEHEIKRVLISDYSKKQDCSSRLEIDGVTVSEHDLIKLGIVLSQPPLKAPVLAQHTLSYIFSIRPQDRATYFKTLLEVTDLDDFRNEVAELAEGVESTEDLVLTKFDTCLSVPEMSTTLKEVIINIPDTTTLNAKLKETAQSILESASEKVPETFEEGLETLENTLADRRNKTFPMVEFGHRELEGWNLPHEDTWTSLNKYFEEQKKIDEETRKLTTLFEEALKIHTIAKIHESVECPLCGKEAALTPERVQFIREQVKDARGFKLAEKAANSALGKLSILANGLTTSVEAALPKFLRTSSIERRQKGFSVFRIRELLGDASVALVDPWLLKLKKLARKGSKVGRQVKNTLILLKENVGQLENSHEVENLRSAFQEIDTHYKKLKIAFNDYKEQSEKLLTSLNEVLDGQSDTAGWSDFLDIAQEAEKLRKALVERQARETVRSELNVALKKLTVGRSWY